MLGSMICSLRTWAGLPRTATRPSESTWRSKHNSKSNISRGAIWLQLQQVHCHKVYLATTLSNGRLHLEFPKPGARIQAPNSTETVSTSTVLNGCYLSCEETPMSGVRPRCWAPDRSMTSSPKGDTTRASSRSCLVPKARIQSLRCQRRRDLLAV